MASHPKPVGTRAPLRRLVWVSLLALAAAGCGSEGPTRASLSEEVEAQLQIPGSVELISTGGHDAEQTSEGPLPAIAWREYGADATWDEVVAYVDAELRARGWERGADQAVDGRHRSGLRSRGMLRIECSDSRRDATLR